MIDYKERVRMKLRIWEREMMKSPGFLQKTSTKLSRKMNELIPDKVHQGITATVKGIVQTVLFGVKFTPARKVEAGLQLKEMDAKADELRSTYKKIASAEGAGTGAGGIFLGMVDFPALLAIKMKFLFELAHIYGFSTSDYRERLFILHVFQLAFSSQEHRALIFNAVKHWDETVQQWPNRENYLQHINWEKFQQEYRDSIDFRKMLQLVPGIGAVVGAWANYALLEDLGNVGMNCYRMRLLY